MLRHFKDLMVWQKSYQLCIEVYRATRNFPNDEKYGLTSQLRRAAVSIPSNIAEGYGRKTIAEYIQFLYIAYGSLCELETQIMLSGEFEYLNLTALRNVQSSIAEIERMLKALIKSLENKRSSS